MANLPLGGQGADYDSKKSRGQVVNLIPQGDKAGEYRTVKRCDGLTLFSNIGSLPIRSNLLINDNYLYFIAGETLYRVDENGVSESLGAVNGATRGTLVANAVPGDSQILVLNGSGSGYIYTNAGGLVSISDADFFPTTSATILNERFWLVHDDTNEFFGSDISDGTSYNPLTFASAEEDADKVKAVIAKKSALWVLGEETTEYWQTYTDTILPLRQVKGGTKEWGILAKDSLAQTNDFFIFLADDRTLRMVQGTQMVEISDLEFNLKVKGNGTSTSPGFSTVTDAIGFFVDDPVNSIYYITFPTEKWTWGYDLNTGLSHTRESEGLGGKWRINSAVKFNGKIICGDSETGKLWELDPNNYQEDTSIMRAKLVTPSISFDADVTIPLIEIDMEVAQNTDPTLSPEMMIYYSRDGGYNWINKGRISLGTYGNYASRVPIRNFGRLVRNKDFILRLEVTDPVGVQFYGAKIYPEMSI